MMAISYVLTAETREVAFDCAMISNTLGSTSAERMAITANTPIISIKVKPSGIVRMATDEELSDFTRYAFRVMRDVVYYLPQEIQAGAAESLQRFGITVEERIPHAGTPFFTSGKEVAIDTGGEVFFP